MMRMVWTMCVAAAMLLMAGEVSAQEDAGAALETANQLATKGKLDAAVPYYKKAIELDPTGYPLAYLNLAEVQKVRGHCEEAGLMFQLYASIRDTEEAANDAETGVKQCKGAKWPRLRVKASHLDARVTVNGYLAATDGEFGPASLPAGEYEVLVEAVDHHPRREVVTLSAEDVSVDVTLEKMTFHGKIHVETNVAGARVRIFEGPSESTKELYDLRTPMASGVQVTEGRHFVEVTARGYDRWIRNVAVGRDETAKVVATLNRSRPPELDRLRQTKSR